MQSHYFLAPREVHHTPPQYTDVSQHLLGYLCLLEIFCFLLDKTDAFRESTIIALSAISKGNIPQTFLLTAHVSI